MEGTGGNLFKLLGNKVLLCLFLMAVMFGLHANIFAARYQQEMDTSYFYPGEDDFNLILAAEKGDSAAVIYLLKKGADPNAETDMGITPLMYATEGGHFTVVKMLVLNGADLNEKPYGGVTALTSAVWKNNLDIAEYLILKGADVNLGDRHGITPLIYATGYSFYIMTDMLIFYGADINKADDYGNTPLITATYIGNTGMVKLLVENGADMNHSDKKGYTPLMVAIQENFQDLIAYYLRNGAEYKNANKYGYTPLALGVRYKNAELVDTLIEMGADVNHDINFATKPMNIAERKSEIYTILKENGAHPSFRPDFSLFTIRTGLNTTSDDLLLSTGMGIRDRRYNIEGGIDFLFRPSVKPVLEKESPSLWYQYWERRMAIALDVAKYIPFTDHAYALNIGLYGRGAAMYTFGKYIGAGYGPDGKIVLSPAAGLYFNGDFLSVEVGYRYLNFNLHEYSPHHFNFSMNFLLNMRKGASGYKSIFWLENNE